MVRKLRLLALLCLPAAGAPPEAAVLLRSVEAGAIIAASDIGKAPVSPVQARGALTAEAIIGQQAVRPLAPGRPLRRYDLTEPQLVRKGQAVRLVLSQGPLTITAGGRALANGAKGEAVRVQNSSSNAMIEGEVIGEGLVRVAAMPSVGRLAATR